jgi:hypothetical protein
VRILWRDQPDETPAGNQGFAAGTYAVRRQREVTSGTYSIYYQALMWQGVLDILIALVLTQSITELDINIYQKIFLQGRGMENPMT